MELQTLKIFSSIQESQIVKGRLESEGIEVFLFDANIATVNPLYINAVGGIKMKVRPNDFERACAFIVDSEMVVCENCGSTNTMLVEPKNKGFFHQLVHQVKLTFFSGLVRQQYRCEDCDAITEFY